MKKQKSKTTKATFGKIINWDKLTEAHKKLLNETINPIYKPITPRHFEKNAGEYFHQKNATLE